MERLERDVCVLLPLPGAAGAQRNAALRFGASEAAGWMCSHRRCNGGSVLFCFQPWKCGLIVTFHIIVPSHLAAFYLISSGLLVCAS